MGILDRFIVRESPSLLDGNVSDRFASEEEALRRRVRATSDHELYQWIDVALASCGKNTQQFTRQGDPETAAAHFYEAELDAMALTVLLQEIKNRRGL